MSTLSATQKEIYRDQDAILNALKKQKPFPYVLSGGTALSRFYFHHRFSEDLDFFCESFSYSLQAIEHIITRLRKLGFTCELVGRADAPGHLKVVSYIFTQTVPVKVDFLEDPFSGMWDPHDRVSESGLSFRVDALDQLYYRKLFSLLEQWHRGKEIVRIKDLIDLYCLHLNHRELDTTIELFRENHIPVDEEKLILIFSSLTEKIFTQGLHLVTSPYAIKAMCKAFHNSAERLVTKGLGS